MAKGPGGRSKSAELDLVDLAQAAASITQGRDALKEALADLSLTREQRMVAVKDALGIAHNGARFVEEVLERNGYFKE